MDSKIKIFNWDNIQKNEALEVFENMETSV